MKSIIGLSLAALSLQGIIPMNNIKLGSQVNQVPVNTYVDQTPVLDTRYKIQQPYIIKQAPVFNQAPIINQVPLVSQAPIINQVPLINQIPVMPRPYHHYQAPVIGTPIYQPTYVQPLIQQQPIMGATVITQTPRLIEGATVITQTPIVNPVLNAAQIEALNRAKCKVAGAYNRLCVALDTDLSHEAYMRIAYEKKYECLKDAICTFRNNKCQWLQTKKYKQCIKRINYFEGLSQQRNFLGN